MRIRCGARTAKDMVGAQGGGQVRAVGDRVHRKRHVIFCRFFLVPLFFGEVGVPADP